MTPFEYKSLLPKKRLKYGNTPTTSPAGERFDSKGEAVRYGQLQQLQDLRLIANLERQKAFPLHVNGKEIGVYRADFCYFDVAANKVVVEDFKSPATARQALFRRTQKHFRAQYGFDITITGAKK